MRRAAKVDANQSEIVQALRLAGCSVLLLHQVGGGCPDILVGASRCCADCGSATRYNHLIEIKDGSKPPSKQKLTTDERAFFESWRGQVEVAATIEQALRIVGKL